MVKRLKVVEAFLESGNRPEWMILTVDAVPHGHWKTSTFIGALRCDAVTATGVFDGAINGELFLA